MEQHCEHCVEHGLRLFEVEKYQDFISMTLKGFAIIIPIVLGTTTVVLAVLK